MLQARLKVVGGKHDGQYIPLGTGRFLIGREEDCHLRPSSEMISRHHCAITLDGFTVRLRDLGSTNGTFVNGEQIHGAVTLSPGDRIEVGKLCFEISIAEVTVDPAEQPAEPMSDSVLSGETTELSSSDTSDEIPAAPVLADSNTNLNAGSDTTVMTPIPAADDSSSVIYPQQPAAAYPPQPAGYPQSPMMYPQPPMMYPQPIYPNYPQPFVYPQVGMPYGQPPMMYPPQGAYPQGTPAQPAPATSEESEGEMPANLPPPETTGVRESEQTTAPAADEKTPAEGETAKDVGKQTEEEQKPSNMAADIIHKHFNRRPPVS